MSEISDATNYVGLFPSETENLNNTLLDSVDNGPNGFYPRYTVHILPRDSCRFNVYIPKFVPDLYFCCCSTLGCKLRDEALMFGKP